MGDAQDVIGNHDGTVNGASLTTDHLGVQNAAYSFDGVDDYILVNDHGDLDLSGDFTIIVSFNTPDVSSNQTLISKWWDGFICGWTLRVSLNAHLYYANRTSGAGSDGVVIGNATILTNTNYVCAATMDNGYLQLYLNGVSDSASSNIGNNNINSADVRIGDYTHTSLHEYFNGKVYMVMIFTRALSSYEIFVITKLLQHGYIYPIMHPRRLIM
jgi:hypothetical protein